MVNLQVLTWLWLTPKARETPCDLPTSLFQCSRVNPRTLILFTFIPINMNCTQIMNDFNTQL